MYPSASYLCSPSEDQVSPEWQSQNMAGLAHGDKQYLTATLLHPRSRAPLQRPEPQGQARACPRHDDPNPRGSPNLPPGAPECQCLAPWVRHATPTASNPAFLPPAPGTVTAALHRPHTTTAESKAPHLTQAPRESRNLISLVLHITSHSPTYSHTSLTNTSSHSTQVNSSQYL
ncbi:hypothetical protein CCUS01_16070 [Colletotrichum cuscutae]|uniref:Uncharacterized protein n=1 Tax=Colletotrichum cuscutae TaxID=1209917 RepID=A0AAI9Y6Z2_9PEZI|nr:hypothetical protein CCUS01_16070 [Colletotrichum cuscutae]